MASKSPSTLLSLLLMSSVSSTKSKKEIDTLTLLLKHTDVDIKYRLELKHRRESFSNVYIYNFICLQA